MIMQIIDKYILYDSKYISFKARKGITINKIS